MDDEKILFADTSEFHLLEHAFKRMGILFQTSGMTSYLKHEVWRRHLWQAMRQETVYQGESPPRYPGHPKSG